MAQWLTGCRMGDLKGVVILSLRGHLVVYGDISGCDGSAALAWSAQEAGMLLDILQKACPTWGPGWLWKGPNANS